MKILYILNYTRKVGHFSESSMIASKKLGYEFHIAGNFYGYENQSDIVKDEKKYDIKIHQVDFKRFPAHPLNIKAYKQLNSIVKNNNFDIIHCNTPTGGVLGRICAIKNKISNIIYEAHGFHFYKGSPIFNWLFYFPIEWFFSFFTDTLITINQEDYKFSKNFLKMKKAAYVPGIGIDVDKINELHLKFNFSNQKKFTIVSVGELNKNKNHKIVIEALSNIKFPYEYLICGEGVLKSELIELAHKKKVNMKLLGYRSDVKDIVANADLFIFPSKREGLSMALMEAMALNTPIICSNIRGNIDLIDNGNGGFLFNPSDSKGLEKSIIKIYENDSLRENFKIYNSQKIKQFDINEVIKRTEEIYASYIKK